MATRAYAYTNAWTAVDHTGYNLVTAGWEGFAQIVRLYRAGLSLLLTPLHTAPSLLGAHPFTDFDGFGLLYGSASYRWDRP